MSFATSRVILSVSAREACEQNKIVISPNRYFTHQMHQFTIEEIKWRENDVIESHLAYKLHDFSQVLLLLQNLLGFCTERNKLREMFVVIFIQSSCVLAVADQPVYWREVFSLSQLLVQSPEHLEGKKTKKIQNGAKERNIICEVKCEDRRLKSRQLLLTWTIPNVAEVTGSEKSPPGGDTLRGMQSI